MVGDSWMGTSWRTTHHLLGPRCLKQWDLFLYCGLLDVQHDRHLVHPFQGHRFSLLGLATNHSHIVNAQCEPTTPVSTLPAPPTFSQSLDANGETDHQVFDASDCSALQLLRVDRLRKRESQEF